MQKFIADGSAVPRPTNDNPASHSLLELLAAHGYTGEQAVDAYIADLDREIAAQRPDIVDELEGRLSVTDGLGPHTMRVDTCPLHLDAARHIRALRDELAKARAQLADAVQEIARLERCCTPTATVIFT